MGKLHKPALFGLLWLCFAATAFAQGSTNGAQDILDPATLALTGIGLVTISLLRRPRKNNETKK